MSTFDLQNEILKFWNSSRTSLFIGIQYIVNRFFFLLGKKIISEYPHDIHLEKVEIASSSLLNCVIEKGRVVLLNMSSPFHAYDMCLEVRK